MINDVRAIIFVRNYFNNSKWDFCHLIRVGWNKILGKIDAGLPCCQSYGRRGAGGNAWRVHGAWRRRPTRRSWWCTCRVAPTPTLPIGAAAESFHLLCSSRTHTSRCRSQNRLSLLDNFYPLGSFWKIKSHFEGTKLHVQLYNVYLIQCAFVN